MASRSEVSSSGAKVEHALVAGGLLRLQLSAEVAHDEVLEVVGALVRAHEVGRQCGVEVMPARVRPRVDNAWSCSLASCSTLGRAGSASHDARASSCSG
jgi:hypothetical protein